jgi:hypothetical protein
MRLRTPLRFPICCTFNRRPEFFIAAVNARRCDAPPLARPLMRFSIWSAMRAPPWLSLPTAVRSPLGDRDSGGNDSAGAGIVWSTMRSKSKK